MSHQSILRTWLSAAIIITISVAHSVNGTSLQDPGITIDHGDDAISDAHESFKDRGMRHYQDLVDVTPFANGFDTYVNVVYGNLIHLRQDFYFSGRGLPLQIVFTYNSGSFFDGRYGYGWQMNYNIRYVTNSENGNIIIVRPDDRTDLFIKQEDGSFKATYGVRDSLIATDNGFKLIVWRDNWNNNGDYTTYQFDSPDHQYVTKIEDRNGNSLTLTYDRSNQLTTVTDGSGRSIQLGYADNKLMSITDPSGREFQYEYDAIGDMVKYTDPLGGEWTYTYSEDCHDCLSVTDANTGQWNINYNDDFAVIGIIDPSGATPFAFTYNWTKSGTTTVTDGNGYNTIYAYDEKDRVFSLTDGAGFTSTRTWADNYTLTSITDGLSNTWLYEYDNRFNVISSEDPLGNISRFDWDPDFRLLISQSDPNGNTTTYDRDAVGNLTTSTDPLGNTTQFTYDPNGQVLTSANALGHTTNYEYDTFGNILKTTDAVGGIRTYTYDNRGNVTTETDPQGNTTSYEYDDNDRLLKVTNAMAGESDFTYNAVGNRTSYQNEAGNTWTYDYNALNQLQSITDPMGGQNTFTYDVMGNNTAFTDANGSTTNFTHDANNQIASATDGSGGISLFQYDGAGNRTAFTDPNGNTTQFTFDANSRLIQRIDPLSNVRSFEHDANGNRISLTDELGNTTRFQYNRNNRLTSITDALNFMTEFQYDAVGNRTAITDALGNTTTYTFDEMGRNIKITTPMGNAWEYVFDGNGNILQRTDANGNITSYSYDALNRRLSTNYPQGGIDWQYDVVGNLVNAKHTGGINDETDIQFDALSRPTSITVDYPGTLGAKNVAYTYDGVGNVKSMTYPDGIVTMYNHDASNRLTGVTSFDGTATFTYDAGGRKIGMVNTIGAVTAIEYDAASRPTHYQVKDAAEAVLLNRYYEYDAAGNKINESRMEDSTYREIRLDAKNQKIEVVYGDSSLTNSLAKPNADQRRIENFTYDAIGRRLTETVDGNLIQFNYDTDGRLISGILPTQTINYGNDANGNRIEMNESGTITSFSHDFENRIVNCTVPDGTQYQYAYSPFGQILRRHREGPTSHHTALFIYSGNDFIERWSGTDYLYARFNPGITNLGRPDQANERDMKPLFDPFGTSSLEIWPDQLHEIDFDEFGKHLIGSRDARFGAGSRYDLYLDANWENFGIEVAWHDGQTNRLLNCLHRRPAHLRNRILSNFHIFDVELYPLKDPLLKRAWQYNLFARDGSRGFQKKAFAASILPDDPLTALNPADFLTQSNKTIGSNSNFTESGVTKWVSNNANQLYQQFSPRARISFGETKPQTSYSHRIFLDFRLEKKFKIRRLFDSSVYMDIFNILPQTNSNNIIFNLTQPLLNSPVSPAPDFIILPPHFEKLRPNGIAEDLVDDELAFSPIRADKLLKWVRKKHLDKINYPWQ